MLATSCSVIRQRLNEDITGLPWLDKAERNARLAECAAIIRALFEGESMTLRGRVTDVDARLYSRPDRAPLLLGGAVTAASARAIGAWADGLVTVGIELDKLRPVIEAFREGGGAGKPVFLQTKVCWDPDPARALAEAHAQWASNAIEGDVNWELRRPKEFETAARFVRPEDMHAYVRISHDLGQHAAWLADLAALGFAEIIVHQVGANQEAFIEAFGQHLSQNQKLSSMLIGVYGAGSTPRRNWATSASAWVFELATQSRHPVGVCGCGVRSRHIQLKPGQRGSKSGAKS